MATLDLDKWDWKKIIHPEEYNDFIKRRKQAIESHHEFEIELRLLNSHHVYHWHLYRCRPVFDAEGNVQKWISSTTDIQKQKEKNRELSNFAHIVSHDLKAPLRGIGKIADWLVMDYKEVLDETGKDYLNMLVSRVNTLENLINGILKYSMSGQLDEDSAVNDLNLVVGDVKEMFSLNENVKIEVETPLPSLMISRTAMLQVFENLVSNAVKHNDKDVAEIRIGVSEHNHNWKFYVKDNGPGIDPQYHEKVFMIFQTLKTRDTQNSTGIGLGIVKKVVEQLGGQVWIESEEGKGCTFFFTISK
jgi:light-regulated signal transduction histidine kinase (bacteriophytochrome)